MRGVVSSNSFRYLSFRDVRVTRASIRKEASLEEVHNENNKVISKKHSRILSDIMEIYTMIDCSELKTEWIVLIEDLSSRNFEVLLRFFK